MNLGLGIWFGLTLFAVALSVILEIFFLLNLHETLRRVSLKNRAMSPGLVWLNFVPFFGFGWFIYTVIKVGDSLRAEYESRDWPPEGDFGYGVGLAAGILNVACLVWGWIPGGVLFIGGALAAGQLACWIIYWVRAARIKNRLGVPLLAPFFPPGTSEYTDGDEDRDALGGSERFTSRCESCGTPVCPEDRFCWRCGSPLD